MYFQDRRQIVSMSPGFGLTRAKLILTVSPDGNTLEGDGVATGWFSTQHNRWNKVTITRKEQPKKEPTPKPTPTPTPSFTVDCFGPGGRFFLPTPATGPGVVGVASIPVTTAAGALSIPLPGVPNVQGLTEPFTQLLQGVNVNNYQAVLNNLRQARGFMSSSSVYSNQLLNQDQVIECFENFCKQQGWPVF